MLLNFCYKNEIKLHISHQWRTLTMQMRLKGDSSKCLSQKIFVVDILLSIFFRKPQNTNEKIKSELLSEFSLINPV